MGFGNFIFGLAS